MRLTFGVTLYALKDYKRGHDAQVARHLFLCSPSPPPMANYELNSTVPSPGGYTSFIEFSPNGRFLGVGDCDHSSVCVLDRRSGFHQTLSAVVPAEPTALAWESSEAFYVGLSNGTFIRYKIKICRGVEMLERCLVNNLFYGTLPVTAMGLDEDSKTLVLSVGPGIFALRRVNATSTFHLRIPMGTNSSLTQFKMIFAPSATYRAVSIFQTIPAVPTPHFPGQSASAPRTRS